MSKMTINNMDFCILLLLGLFVTSAQNTSTDSSTEVILSTALISPPDTTTQNGNSVTQNIYSATQNIDSVTQNAKSTTQGFVTSSATANPTGTSKDGASNIEVTTLETVSSGSESISTNTSPDNQTDNGIQDRTTNINSSIKNNFTANEDNVNTTIQLTTSTPTNSNTTGNVNILQTQAVTNLTLPPVNPTDYKSSTNTQSSFEASTEMSTVTVYSNGITNSSELISSNTEMTSTPSVTKATLKCKKPMVNFTNGNFYLNKTTIVYSCYKDFVLEGESVGFCRENGTWSVETPRCVYKIPQDWKEIFIHYTKWFGYYNYHKDEYHFSFEIVRVTKDNQVHAEFRDDPAFVTMIGHQTENSSIIFKTDEVKQRNERIKDRSFQIEGYLQNDNTICTALCFHGKASTKDASYTVIMSPSHAETQPAIDLNERKALVIALSIILTSTLILALSLLAYHLMKKRGLVGSHQGHNTLTSFENPVYEFENSMNTSLASES